MATPRSHSPVAARQSSFPTSCSRPGAVELGYSRAEAPLPPRHILMSVFEKHFSLLGGLLESADGCELILALLLPGGRVGFRGLLGCRSGKKARVQGGDGTSRRSFLALMEWGRGLSQSRPWVGTQH